MRYAYLLLPVLLLLASCEDQKPSGTPSAHQGTELDEQAGTPGDFYKRLSGTLAGKNVVVHLIKYGGHIGGYFQYVSQGQPIRLASTEDSAGGDHFKLAEVPVEGKGGNWDITLADKKVTGKWTGDNGTAADIALQENYPDGACPLNAFFYAAEGRVFYSMPYPCAHASYGIIWPAQDAGKEAAAFMRSAIATDMKLESAVGPFKALKTRAWRYFGNYRLDVKKVIDSNAAESERRSPAYQYETGFNHNVLYNDEHWLILEDVVSNYTGGAHPLYSKTYQNLDLSASKAWHLEDVVADTNTLGPLLNLAARDYFHLQPGQPGDDRMLVKSVPVTTNFYLTPGGLTFVYNPYEIASYADGTIPLFIPYSKILPLLTPAFKKRAGLEAEAAGSVMVRGLKKPDYFYRYNTV